jgi:uncharacterized YigZ family protein
VHRVESIVRRSRFVTTVGHAPLPETAHGFIERVRDGFPDATHCCWAFVAGPPGSTRSIGMSDAGEPRGTAGRPMLTALLHGGVGEIVAVCARWFGGTKLGTGGLARAYSTGVTLALASLPVTLVRIESHVEIELSYPHVDGLRQALDEHDAEVVAQDYGVRVRYRVAVPSSRLERLRSRLADLTRGDGVMRDASDS